MAVKNDACNIVTQTVHLVIKQLPFTHLTFVFVLSLKLTIK